MMGSMWRRFKGGKATGNDNNKKKTGPESDPRPVAGRHHTASTTGNGKGLLFGGGARPDREVRLLDTEAVVRRTLRIRQQVRRDVRCGELTLATRHGPWGELYACIHSYGDPIIATAAVVTKKSKGGGRNKRPGYRKMHAAVCLLPWLPYLAVYGGARSCRSTFETLYSYGLWFSFRFMYMVCLVGVTMV